MASTATSTATGRLLGAIGPPEVAATNRGAVWDGQRAGAAFPLGMMAFWEPWEGSRPRRDPSAEQMIAEAVDAANPRLSAMKIDVQHFQVLAAVGWRFARRPRGLPPPPPARTQRCGTIPPLRPPAWRTHCGGRPADPVGNQQSELELAADRVRDEGVR
jgi:hypothetical protein